MALTDRHSDIHSTGLGETTKKKKKGVSRHTFCGFLRVRGFKGIRDDEEESNHQSPPTESVQLT